MARIRTIKPEFPHSESMGRVSRESRLCFILLWTLADDAGRLRGNSRMLASLLYPYDDDANKHIEKWLDQLTSEGCIARYEVSGTHYVQIMKWLDHQKIDKPSQSKLPSFADDSRKLEKVLESSPLEGKGMEGNGKGMEDSATPQSAEPPAVLIPLVDKSEYPITVEAVTEWQATYPGVNVLQELREMRAWSVANPANRKTAKGVNAFVVRWLSKEQDKGGTKSPYAKPDPSATVPSRQERDPELTRIDIERGRAVPMPAAIREQMEKLKQGATA